MSVALELWHDGGSIALDLWRALEARHNLRGPDGRFIKAGGGGSDRPSLADAVRGTAALGPKRQRADKGGMSVADAVRSAARRSDSTGRPTQRTPEHHRAEGAHDVADEVDRALADAGVPDEVRQQIAARARAVADGHGPRKRAPSKPTPPPSPAESAPSPPVPAGPRREGIDGLLDVLADIPSANERSLGREPLVDTIRRTQADVEAGRISPQEGSDRLNKLSVRYSTIPGPTNDAISTAIGDAATHLRSLPGLPRPTHASSVNPAHETAVRDAVAKLSGGREGEWVGLADLRAELGGMSREEQDAALRQMVRSPGVQIEEQTNQKALRQRDRDAAIRIGGRDQHVIQIGPAPAPSRPKPSKARNFDRAAAANVASKLETASSMDDGRAALDGLTVPQLRQVAEMLGVAVGSGDTKAKALDRIVNSVVGRRLDSAAIGRMVNR